MPIAFVQIAEKETFAQFTSMTTLTNLSTVNFVTDQKEMNVESALFNYFVFLYLSFGRDIVPDQTKSQVAVCLESD